MITDSLFERKAALYRAIGSNQALLDQIAKTCETQKNTLGAEYYMLKNKLEDMTHHLTKLPDSDEEKKAVRNIMLRLMEIRRAHIVYDDTEAGAKYSVDTEKVDHYGDTAS